MKIIDFLRITKFKIIATLTIFVILMFVGGETSIDRVYPQGVRSWRSGVNPCWGFIPKAVFVPLALVTSYLIPCLISIFLKRRNASKTKSHLKPPKT
jgi:hypothetical protein